MFNNYRQHLKAIYAYEARRIAEELGVSEAIRYCIARGISFKLTSNGLVTFP